MNNLRTVAYPIYKYDREKGQFLVYDQLVVAPNKLVSEMWVRMDVALNYGVDPMIEAAGTQVRYEPCDGSAHPSDTYILKNIELEDSEFNEQISAVIIAYHGGYHKLPLVTWIDSDMIRVG